MPVFVVSFKFCKSLTDFFQKFADFAKNGIFVKPTINDILLLLLCFNFCQTFDKFLPNWPFSPKLQFLLIINSNFLRPLMNPCQISEFCNICHFRKTHNYRHAFSSSCFNLFFTRPFLNYCQICHFRKTHNCQHALFLISFEFWQTLNELLPNLPFLL